MGFEANICHFSYVFTVTRVFTVIFCLQTVLWEKGPLGKGRRRKVILYSRLNSRLTLAKPNMPKEMKESEKISSEAVVESSKAEKSRQTLSENKIQEKKKEIKSKCNPFDFPRPGDSEDEISMFRTNGELLGLIKTQLESNKTIKLPSLILPTAGRGIVIKESWTIEFEEVDFCYEGKSKIPKSFILHSDNQLIAVLVRRDKNKNEEEIDKLKRKDCNIIEIDLSWAKDGVTEDELKYLTIFCGFLQETLCEFRA